MFGKSLDWFVDRLGERSTYLGLVSIAAAFGVQVRPDLLPHIMSVGMGLAGLVGVLKKEK